MEIDATPTGQLMSDIDPIQFGSLKTQVANLEREVGELRQDVKSLLAMANKGRGGMWMGMAIISSMSGLFGYAAEHWLGK